MNLFSIAKALAEISCEPLTSYYDKKESILPTPLDVPWI